MALYELFKKCRHDITRIDKWKPVFFESDNIGSFVYDARILLTACELSYICTRKFLTI